jgi:hypothetical protein
LHICVRKLLVAFYVDDILVASKGSDSSEVEKLFQHLNQEFIVKNLGPADRFLGINIQRNDNGELSLDMKDYIDTLPDFWEKVRLKSGSISTPLNNGF